MKPIEPKFSVNSSKATLCRASSILKFLQFPILIVLSCPELYGQRTDQSRRSRGPIEKKRKKNREENREELRLPIQRTSSKLLWSATCKCVCPQATIRNGLCKNEIAKLFRKLSNMPRRYANTPTNTLMSIPYTNTINKCRKVKIFGQF